MPKLPQRSTGVTESRAKRATSQITTAHVPKVNEGSGGTPNVPNVTDTGLGSIGEAVAGYGRKLKAAEARVTAKEEGNAIATLLEQATTEKQQLFDKYDNEFDFSVGDNQTQFGADLTDLKMKYQGMFDGSEENSVIYSGALDRLENQYTAMAAGQGAKIREERRSKLFGSIIGAAQREVQNRPELVDTMIDAAIKDPRVQTQAMNPIEEEAYADLTKRTLFESAIRSTIISQDNEGARDLMARDDVAASLGEGKLDTMFALMRDMELAETKALREASSAFAVAKKYYTPEGATDEEIRKAAAQIQGFDLSKNLHLEDLGGEMGVYDEDTGTIINRIKKTVKKGKLIEKGEEGYDEGLLIWQPEDGSKPEVIGNRTLPPEYIRNKARYESEGKILGRVDALKSYLESVGLGATGTSTETMAKSVVDAPKTVPLFGGTVTATPAMETVSRMVRMSQAYANIKEPAMANYWLSRSRQLIENDSELRKQKWMDQPLSFEMSKAMQMPVGSTMRDAVGKMPLSHEEQTRRNARASAIEKAHVQQMPVMRSIDEVTNIGNKVLEKMEEDPRLVGTLGGIRATGRAAQTVLEDLGMHNLIKQAKLIAMESSTMIDGKGATMSDIEGWFDDPALSVLDIMQISLGLNMARVSFGHGRLPVDLMNKWIGQMKLTGTGSRKIGDRIRFVMDLARNKKESIEEDYKAQTIYGGLPVRVWDQKTKKWVDQ